MPARLFRCSFRKKEPQCGFTLIELILVLVIVGTMAVVAIPRFFQVSTFDTRRFVDITQSALRFAQKSAVAKRRNVCADFSTANQITFTFSSAAGAAAVCDTSLSGPTGESPFQVKAPASITLTSSTPSLIFDAAGKPGAAASLQITGDGTTAIAVEAETGYVH